MRRFHNESISRGVANQYTFQQWDIYKSGNTKYVPFLMDGSVLKIKKKLKSAMKAIESVSCIRFITRNPDVHKDYLHFFKVQVTIILYFEFQQTEGETIKLRI